MTDFAYYIHSEVPTHFSPSELNEPLLMMCNILARAIREQSDTLTLCSTAVTWSRNGTSIGTFCIHLQPTVSFPEALAAIVQRDARVRQHLHLRSTTEDCVVYQIVV